MSRFVYMPKVRQIVVGMDTEGKYIVVSLSKKGIKVSSKALHKLSNVDEVRLCDANIILSGSFLRKGRAAKSLLAAFENCLVVYESVRVSGLTRVGSTVRVVLQTEEYLTSYEEYISRISRGLYSKPKQSCLSVEFHDVEEFLGEEDEFLKFCCERECEEDEWDTEDLDCYGCPGCDSEDEEEDEEWSEEDFEEALIDEDYCDECEDEDFEDDFEDYCDECEDGDFEDDFEYHDDYYFMDNDEYEEEFSTDGEDLEEPFETTEDLLSSLFPGYEVEDDSPDEFVTPEFEEIGNNRGTSEVSKHSSKSKNKKKRKKNSGRRS